MYISTVLLNVIPLCHYYNPIICVFNGLIELIYNENYPEVVRN